MNNLIYIEKSEVKKDTLLRQYFRQMLCHAKCFVMPNVFSCQMFCRANKLSKALPRKGHVQLEELDTKLQMIDLLKERLHKIRDRSLSVSFRFSLFDLYLCLCYWTLTVIVRPFFILFQIE